VLAKRAAARPLVAIDLLEWHQITGVTVLQGDFTEPTV
jgi:23S rRNA U2552 (ribose-2'-O)-methylase RlmE/FtsJ